jgi:hypothetical protein
VHGVLIQKFEAIFSEKNSCAIIFESKHFACALVVTCRRHNGPKSVKNFGDDACNTRKNAVLARDAPGRLENTGENRKPRRNAKLLGKYRKTQVYETHFPP